MLAVWDVMLCSSPASPFIGLPLSHPLSLSKVAYKR